MKKSLLILGKPHSGKTTFLTQLYSRLDVNTSSLRFYKAIANLTPIIDAVKLLANGCEPKPTPTDKSAGLMLPIQHKEEQLDLYCPDYGGEQINHIIENRELDSKWCDSIIESDNWILFIRPSSLTGGFDLSNKTIKPEILKNGNGVAEEYSISDQSAFIELLQIMLHTKAQDSHFKNSTVKLTVVLTCWDEMQTDAVPKEKLRQCLPLLLNFIEANWQDNKINVVGLSALGFSLKEKENQDKYQSEGSENFGYLIKPDGQKTQDITELILEAI
jgi:hypothetical protein